MSCFIPLQKFYEVRNTTKSLIKASRIEFFKKRPSLLKSNSKKLRSVFKSTSGQSLSQDDVEPSRTSSTRTSPSLAPENSVNIANLLTITCIQY